MIVCTDSRLSPRIDWKTWGRQDGAVILSSACTEDCMGFWDMISDITSFAGRKSPSEHRSIPLFSYFPCRLTRGYQFPVLTPPAFRGRDSHTQLWCFNCVSHNRILKFCSISNISFLFPSFASCDSLSLSLLLFHASLPLFAKLRTVHDDEGIRLWTFSHSLIECHQALSRSPFISLYSEWAEHLPVLECRI